MDLIKSADWPILGFLSVNAILDYYLYKHLTWRIIVYIPDSKK